MVSAFEWGDRLPVVRSRRLELAGMDEADLPALLEIFGDPEVMRFWSSPPLADEAAARRLLDDIRESFAARRLFQWGIRRRGDARVIGTCTVFRLEVAHRRAEVGFAVARREWTKGIATEAVGAVLEFAFDRLGLHRLEADVDPRNGASLRVLERHGFQREGLLRERYHQAGETQDAVLLGLLRSDWAPQALPGES